MTVGNVLQSCLLIAAKHNTDENTRAVTEHVLRGMTKELGCVEKGSIQE